MTRPDGDYDGTLSRVLRSTLDPVEPAGDGLAKIQRRIAEPWLKRRVSLLRTELAALAWLIFVRCEPFLTRARAALAPITAGSHRGKASPGRRHAAASHDRTGDAGRPGWLGSTMAWLRPALAVAGAVVIVVVGVFALADGKVPITPANRTSSPTNGSPGQAPQHHAHSGLTGRDMRPSTLPQASHPRYKPTEQGGQQGSPRTVAYLSGGPVVRTRRRRRACPHRQARRRRARRPPRTTPSPTTSPTTTAGGGDAASPTPSPTGG